MTVASRQPEGARKMSDEDEKPVLNKTPRWGKRALWFLAFWVGGVLTLAAISYSLRTLLSIPY